MSSKLVLFAPNVGVGGGLVLLQQLLAVSWPFTSVTALLDSRAKESLGASLQGQSAYWFKSSVAGRWRAERKLRDVASRGDVVLCFHNLPPVLPNNATNICYVQNANLVGIIPPSHLSGWLRLRCAIERTIAKTFKNRIERYLVQTPTMGEALRNWYGPGAPPITVIPFGPQELQARKPSGRRPSTRWDFLYASDGPVHKNHQRLLDAWGLLAEDGHFPSLALTLHPERDAVLCRRVDDMAAVGVNVTNLGQMSHGALLEELDAAGAVIFPSYAESFGLPLLEAEAAGVPILASELDYVRDVCSPVETFDPFSSRSIARAVRRYLDLPAQRVSLLTPERFAMELGRLAAQARS